MDLKAVWNNGRSHCRWLSSITVRRRIALYLLATILVGVHVAEAQQMKKPSRRKRKTGQVLFFGVSR